MIKLDHIKDRKNTNSLKWNRIINDNPNLGDDIVPMSLADLDFPHPVELVEGLKEYTDEMVFGYTETSDKYYLAVINWFKNKHNWLVKKEEILLSPGVVPAIYNSIKAFTERKDGVIIMDPVYHPFSIAVENLGRTLVTTELKREKGIYKIDFSDFEEKAKDEKNKVLILCSPHNPLGRVWSKEELKKIDKITRANDILVLSDEIHFDLVRPGYNHTVYANVSEGAKNNSIIFTAPSKSFNIAALKNSNIVIHNEEIRDKLETFLVLSGNMLQTNPYGQKATEIVYNNCSYWLDSLNHLIDENYKLARKYIDENLTKINTVELQGTYLLWLDFRKLNLEQEELNNLLLETGELFLDDGTKFGNKGEGYMRMNIAYPREIVRKAFERLKELEEMVAKNG